MYQDDLGNVNLETLHMMQKITELEKEITKLERDMNMAGGIFCIVLIGAIYLTGWWACVLMPCYIFLNYNSMEQSKTKLKELRSHRDVCEEYINDALRN